ncbi:MAG: GatB/YqeY domain-containing protein [bacterium]|nr:GatB/YqeY domain-containing protein [bacterium]
MSIVEDVSAQMKDAMKARDKLRTNALRNMRSVLLNEMKKDNSTDLPDEVSIGQLRRLEKQRGESIDAFEQAGRSEQAEAERSELAVIREFLPQLADAAATREIVANAIESTGAASKAELGKVMGAVMKAHKGEVDGNLARTIAAELLGD